MSAGERINVAIRIRPLSHTESDANEESVFSKVMPEGLDAKCALVVESNKDAGVLFDSVYTEESTNEDIFNDVGKKAG